MTAPSLLDELEGVVRLAEKATPGEWTATVGHDVKQQHGVTVMKAWAGRGPQQEHNAAYVVALVNWFRTHHAEIAGMAKRLEVAERDAAKWKGVESVMAMMADKVEGQITSSCGLLLIDHAARNNAGKVELRFGGVSNVETGELGDWIVRIEKAASAATQEGEG